MNAVPAEAPSYFDLTNMADAWCGPCGAFVPARTGLKLRNPLRLLCGRCAIKAPVPNPNEGAIVALGQAGLNLRDFQVEDVTKLRDYRAHLIGSQMGTGKTVVAAVGCLRSDLPNLVFVPAGLKENWRREIAKWRPDLKLLPKVVRLSEVKPGEVVVASYGAIPGMDCQGCVRLRSALRARKKTSKGKARVPKILCMHFGPETQHPSEFTIGEGTRAETIPYHVKPSGATCEGCWQKNPTPVITRPIVLMADEVHALKDPGAKRTRLWRRLRESVSAAGGYVFGLSGTPWENRPQEGWEVLSSLGLALVAFDSWDQYRWIFEDWYDRAKGERKKPDGERYRLFLERMRRVRIFRRTKDVLSLPPEIDQEISVEISEKTVNRINEAAQAMFAQRRAWHDVESGLLGNPWEEKLSRSEAERRSQKYEERVRSYFIQKPWDFDEELVAAVTEVLTTKTPAFNELSKIRRLLSLAKLDAVTKWLDTCREEEEPVVLFCQHVEVVRRIGQLPGWGVYHGGMGGKARDQAVQDFQGGKIPLGLSVSLGAGREGITLTRARVGGFVDENWNPARNKQARARLARMGAEEHESLLFVRFVAQHPVDKLVVQTLREKSDLIECLNVDDGEVA